MPNKKNRTDNTFETTKELRVYLNIYSNTTPCSGGGGSVEGCILWGGIRDHHSGMLTRYDHPCFYSLQFGIYEVKFGTSELLWFWYLACLVYEVVRDSVCEGEPELRRRWANVPNTVNKPSPISQHCT